MKLLTCASLVAAAVSTEPHPPNKMMLFEQFMAKHKRYYISEAEKAKRFEIFSRHVDFIYETNAKKKSYTLAITEHTDLSFEEWRDQYITGYKPPAYGMTNRSTFAAPRGFTEPDSVDWVTAGGVTSVKNQGSCGSCWTFSAVGALEGAMHASGRDMVDLSMQHILACDKGGHGCRGGLMDQAFDWVKDNGIPALKDEPYLCKEGSSAQCQNMKCGGACTQETGSHCFISSCAVGVCTGIIDKVCKCPEGQCFADGKCGPPKTVPLALKPGDVVKINDVEAGTENALEAAVAQQPVSVAIEADSRVFQLYSGGVLTSEACGTQLDHGVLAVGYGTDKGQKYWKVKNSWGTTFGENGYIRIAKGDPHDGGECGIRKQPSFPTIKAASSIVV